MRLGVLGGTFDPPHVAHLLLAEQARDQLDLDRVLWVPAADPPHKRDSSVLSVEHRMAMVRLSIEDNPGFALSTVDVDRVGPHYTVDMLALLAAQYQGADFYLLIGGDSLRDLPTWQHPAQLIERTQLAVMSRPGVSYDLFTLEDAVPGVRNRLLFLDTPLVDVSGRTIRQCVLSGRSIRYLVPEPVREYIVAHNLYLDSPVE
jgi:nicotinate-nucleotide adenylyltransferase